MMPLVHDDGDALHRDASLAVGALRDVARQATRLAEAMALKAPMGKPNCCMGYGPCRIANGKCVKCQMPARGCA